VQADDRAAHCRNSESANPLSKGPRELLLTVIRWRNMGCDPSKCLFGGHPEKLERSWGGRWTIGRGDRGSCEKRSKKVTKKKAGGIPTSGEKQ